MDSIDLHKTMTGHFEQRRQQQQQQTAMAHPKEHPNGPAVNPYRRNHSWSSPRVIMGPQSQNRLTLQERTHVLQGDSHNKRKAGQLTLFGDKAFEPEKNCVVCKARLAGRISHKGHHRLCTNNRRTKGMSPATMEQAKIDQALKQHFQRPLMAEEKASSRHMTEDATQSFFSKRICPTKEKQQQQPIITTTTANDANASHWTGQQFCSLVTEKVNNSLFQKEHASSRAPLAMLAFANVVMERLVNKKKKSHYADCFDGLSFVVPACKEMCGSPHYHSIVGQELLLVDWERMYGLHVTCPGCKVRLDKDRTNFSKNKVLFPTFHLHGAPSWAMVMKLECSRCKNRWSANDGEILVQLPAHVSAAYPVDTKYALDNKTSHLGRSATDVFDMLMPTCGNGDLCSRLLYNSINRAYMERVSNYHSYWCQEKNSNIQQCAEKNIQQCVEKNGGYIRAFPPLGDSARDTYDQASSSISNYWLVSDHDRHAREIQGVQCHKLYAEDHTHEVTKNYFRRKQIGAVALWDVGTETGEIATAVMVPSTKTKDLSHAAISLSKRTDFNPKAMYSDRWPTKIEYWKRVFANVEGRLGLFHFLQRITRTIRKRHVDYLTAVTQLLDAVHFYNQDDHEALLVALKDGTLTGKVHSDQDIVDLKATKYFRQRYSKCLRKEIRHPNIMRDNLDQWFIRFKCAATEGSSPPMGRRDPVTGDALFTSETKNAIQNCKERSMHLQDPLALEEMHDVILPNPNSPHGLKEYLSRRGESNLESFHLMLAHFGNTGMRETLVDNLNLTGTARFNLKIRHKIRISKLTDANTRAKTPAGWETVTDYFNHSELNCVNHLARSAGIAAEPFSNAEPLQSDNGERFFSTYLSWMKDAKPAMDENDMCLCDRCAGNVPKETAEPTKTLAQNTVGNGTADTTTQQPMTQTNTATMTMATATNDTSTRNQSATHWAPAMPQPVMWINPYFVPWTDWNHCCRKYKEYCFRLDRRGRPPHDHGCRFKPSLK